MSQEIFISHSADDRNIADAACAAFEARRFSCWIAPRDVLPGQDRYQAVLGAIRNCRAFVLILSARSADAPHVVREAERALEAGVPMLVFRIEEVAASPALERALAGADRLEALTPPVAPHLDYLGDRIAILLERRERTMPPGSLPPLGRRRHGWLTIALAGLLGLLAIALAAYLAGR